MLALISFSKQAFNTKFSAYITICKNSKIYPKCDHFPSRKTKDKFLKACTKEVEARKLRINKSTNKHEKPHTKLQNFLESTLKIR